VSYSTLLYHHHEGNLPGIKVGTEIRVNTVDLLEYLKKRSEKQPELRAVLDLYERVRRNG
jgi:hypothetical protein